MNDEMKNPHAKGIKTAKTVTSAVLAGCLVASLGLNIYQANESATQNRKVNKFIDNQLERQAKEEEKENTYQEDGYKVGNQYEIRSTTHISDAYKSGDDSGLKDEDKETLKMASDVLQKIIKDGMSNYEKELAVYRWMFKHVGQGHGSSVTLPGASSNAYTPHGALSGQNTVCVGYATTFRLFMNMLDMDCHIVHNEYHSWDMVQLDDQEWYQVDIYSDVSGKCQYQNFNMTDDISRSSHDWDESALPQAKGVKYTYAVQNNKTVKDIYKVPAQVKKALDKKRSSAFFKFEKPLSREELPIADYLVSQMNTAIMSMPGFENYNMGGMWYLDEQDQYILGIFIRNYGESENSEFDADSPEGKKLQKAITKAFGVDTPQDADPKNTDSKDAVVEMRTDVRMLEI
ncbi:MAG: hypothetical protein HFH33_12650 [Eubacterium sp.]|jgi:Uncharacterized protein involved in cytokinesis, contains TGc (transglutaminase/protease-like) domain|nr:hypothetical protein [Eubacterium sp.]